jgi:hypothetical protein
VLFCGGLEVFHGFYSKPFDRRAYNAGMRYRLRTLLVFMAIGPPLLAVAWHDSTGAFPAMLCIAIPMIVIPMAVHLSQTKANR